MPQSLVFLNFLLFLSFRIGSIAQNGNPNMLFNFLKSLNWIEFANIDQLENF